MKRTCWIGLIHVKPVNEHSLLGSAAGGFAAALALAVSADELAHLVEHYVTAHGLAVVEVEDVEPFEHRLRTGQPDDRLRADAAALTNENPVSIGQLDVYAEDEDLQ